MKNTNEKSDKQESGKKADDKPVQKKDEAEKKGFPGYPHYPPSEDIFNREDEVDIDTEKIIDKKSEDNNVKK